MDITVRAQKVDENFQIQKWISQLELKKQMKEWGHLPSFLFFLPKLWSLNCQK